MNSLIAEKLTSLEFEKQSSKFQSEDSEKYFKGRREQAMRQMLYFDEYFSKVNIPPDKVQSNLKLASRRVNLQFLNLLLHLTPYTFLCQINIALPHLIIPSEHKL